MSTIEQAHVKILRGVHVKDENLECSASPIKVEWYGTMYSGKFGSLLSYENLSISDEQLEIKHKAVLAQDAKFFSQQKLMERIGWTMSYSDINNYTVEQVKQILKNTKIEIEHLANLEHENIIKFFGIFYEEDKLPILIMESIQCDLYEYLFNNQSISWNHVFTILQGISEGLSYLHEVRNMIHHNICTKSIVLTKSLVAKLTSFELAVVVPHDGTAQEENFLTYKYDVFCFGEVLVNMVHCTQHVKEQLHLLFESMHEFAVECMSLRNPPTSAEILNTIEKYRRQYESTRDDSHDGSFLDHFTGLLERLTKENEQLKNQIEQAKDQAKCLELKRLKFEEENSQLNSRLKKLRNDNNYLQTRYEKLENESKDLRTSNVLLNQQMSQLCEQLEELKNRRAKFEEENSQLNSRLNKLRNDNNYLQTSIETLENESKDLRTSKETLENESKDLRTSNEKLENESKDLRTSNEKLENESKDLRISNEKLENESKDLRTSNEKLENESKDLRTSNEKLENESKDLRTSNEKLENECKDLRTSNEKLENESKDLRASNVKLNQQMSQLCEQLKEPKNSQTEYPMAAGHSPLKFASHYSKLCNTLTDLLPHFVQEKIITTNDLEEINAIVPSTEKLQKLMSYVSGSLRADVMLRIMEEYGHQATRQLGDQIRKSLLVTDENIRESDDSSTVKPTIRLLNNHVKKIAPKWRNLGIQLLPDENHFMLDIIAENHHRDVMTCCTKMLEYWLTVDISASWIKLIEALERIDANALAEKIRIDFLKETDNNDGGDPKPKPNDDDDNDDDEPKPDDDDDDEDDNDEEPKPNDDDDNDEKSKPNNDDDNDEPKPDGDDDNYNLQRYDSSEDHPKPDTTDDQQKDTRTHQWNATQTLPEGLVWTALTCLAGVTGYAISEDVGIFTGAIFFIITGVMFSSGTTDNNTDQ